MPPSEIRRDAREALKGKWGKAVSIVLAFFAISMLMGFVQSLVGDGTILYNILEFAFLVINVPLSFGLLISFIKLKRNEEFSSFDFLKEGFSRFGKAWGIQWHTFLKLLLHIILGIFICIIIPIILSLIITVTNTDPSLAPGLSFSGLIALGLGLYLLIIWMFPKYLLYVLAYYISFDNPDLSSKECVKKSAELMKGNRGNYFMLELSFIGWALLTLLTLGIGVLWLTPYMQVAVVCFYERVLKNKEVKQSESTEKVEE